MSLSSVVLPNFSAAVERLFRSWTALQLAIRQGFGGFESEAKGKWLITAIVQWFQENEKLEGYEVEEFLNDVLYNEFDTVVDDGSVRKVSDQICQFYVLCLQGQLNELQALLELLPSCSGALQQSIPSGGGDEDMSDSDSDDDEDDGAAAQGHGHHSHNGQCCHGDEPIPTLVPYSGGSREAEGDVRDAEMEEADNDGEGQWTKVHRHNKKR